MEPQLGGAIIETLHDSITANWGKITVWEPGSEVAFTWHLRRPEGKQTLVSVEFMPKRDGTPGSSGAFWVGRPRRGGRRRQKPA